LEFKSLFGDSKKCLNIYDWSSGHSCLPKDALHISKINRGPGCNRKEKLIIRNNWFIRTGNLNAQSMHFQSNDVLYINIAKGTKMSSGMVEAKDFGKGYVIHANDASIDNSLKGAEQILAERNILFSTGGWKREKRRREINIYKKKVRDKYEEDKHDLDRLLALLSFTRKEEVVCELRQIQCGCC
jgi:hypothetical protein